MHKMWEQTYKLTDLKSWKVEIAKSSHKLFPDTDKK